MANAQGKPNKNDRSVEITAEDAAHLKLLLSLIGTSEEAIRGNASPSNSFEEAELLKRRAQWLRDVRRKRCEVLPPSLVSEAAWGILLELFILNGIQRVSFSKLVKRTGAPMTTVLRWINRLSDQDLVTSTVSKTDARKIVIDLSPAGLEIMAKFVRDVPSLPS